MKYLDQGTRKIITENLNSISQVSPSRASYSKKKKKGRGWGAMKTVERLLGPRTSLLR